MGRECSRHSLPPAGYKAARYNVLNSTGYGRLDKSVRFPYNSNMDDESLNNLRAASMKLYDDFEPVRQFIKENPEWKDAIVRVLGEALTQSCANNFYGPSPH